MQLPAPFKELQPLLIPYIFLHALEHLEKLRNTSSPFQLISPPLLNLAARWWEFSISSKVSRHISGWVFRSRQQRDRCLPTWGLSTASSRWRAASLITMTPRRSVVLAKQRRNKQIQLTWIDVFCWERGLPTLCYYQHHFIIVPFGKSPLKPGENHNRFCHHYGIWW